MPASRTFFISANILGKRPLLQSYRSADLFIDTLYEYRSQGRFRLHAFVVMPDHFHTLLTVGPDLTIERAVQFIKGGFAFRAGKQLGFRAPVWQKGFSEVLVRDSVGYVSFVKYIHDNPVRRHLMGDAESFPFSSAHPGFQLDPAPQGLKPLSTDPTVRHG